MNFMNFILIDINKITYLSNLPKSKTNKIVIILKRFAIKVNAFRLLKSTSICYMSGTIQESDD